MLWACVATSSWVYLSLLELPKRCTQHCGSEQWENRNRASFRQPAVTFLLCLPPWPVYLAFSAPRQAWGPRPPFLSPNTEPMAPQGTTAHGGPASHTVPFPALARSRQSSGDPQVCTLLVKFYGQMP